MAVLVCWAVSSRRSTFWSRSPSRRSTVLRQLADPAVDVGRALRELVGRIGAPRGELGVRLRPLGSELGVQQAQEKLRSEGESGENEDSDDEDDGCH